MESKRTAFRPFTGMLSVADAIKGTQLVQANATRLVADAKVLLQAGRATSAAMLATMALEEMARIVFPLELATIVHEKRRNEVWRRFRDPCHDFPWAVFRQGAETADDANLNAMMAFINALGRRADYIEPGLWIDPSELITSELASAIVGTAERFCSNPIGSRSLEIWIEVANALPANASSKMALRKYQSTLESEGLIAEASFVAHINTRYDVIRKPATTRAKTLRRHQ